MIIIRRLYAWATGGKLVCLQAHDGETKIRIARVNPFGEWRAAFYEFDIGIVVLLPDGSCSGALYVRRWIEIR